MVTAGFERIWKDATSLTPQFSRRDWIKQHVSGLPAYCWCLNPELTEYEVAVVTIRPRRSVERSCLSVSKPDAWNYSADFNVTWCTGSALENVILYVSIWCPTSDENQTEPQFFFKFRASKSIRSRPWLSESIFQCIVFTKQVMLWADNKKLKSLCVFV